MYRLLLAAIIFAGSHASAAQRDYVGTWCEVFDDFTRVIKINESDDLSGFSVGNGAGEVGYHQKGYVSRGATQFLVVIEDQDQGVVDYSVRNQSNAKVLTLKYRDGRQDQLVACIVKADIQ